MKIIGISNHDDESISDTLIATGVSQFYGVTMVKALNDEFCNSDNARTFFRLVPDDHKLYKWEP